MDLEALQKRVYQNKLKHGFNVTDIPLEFCFLSGEVAEAFDAWRKKKADLGEELADIALYVLGLAEILHIDLGRELEDKMIQNEARVYRKIDGVTVRVGD